MNYKKINNITGWVVFIIAAFTYLSTVEPTASFWDCGEFIATSYKLEVGHPPGAPLFMILARIASLFASDPSTVAVKVNMMSALASAFTILFLFWTITHLVKKLVKKDELSTGNIIAIMGSGVVGALAYTFSDTFWFSAVEAEVYAMSSLFTALVVWAMLKWENVADEPYSNKWIILIAYLMGLSIGVHLLNLLAIPAMVFIFYFKKYKVTRKGIIFASLAAIAAIGGIMYGIIPGAVTLASEFELFFVNTLGMPFNSGVIFYAVLLIASIVVSLYLTFNRSKNHLLVSISFALAIFMLGVTMGLGGVFAAFLLAGAIFAWVYTKAKAKHEILNTIILAGTVIMIGYSSFSMVVIRSLANPPLDENNPEDVFSLLSYLKREQYGENPLFYGQYYNAPVTDVKEGAPVYIQKDGKYVVADHKQKVVYDSRFETVFPRMWSSQPNHIQAYKDWSGLSEDGGIPIYVNKNGERKKLIKPTFLQNLKFFISYQVGHMYLRYFMWNFVGRQNDIQGHGSVNKGNWISGIPGFGMEPNLEQLPDSMKKQKARNVYFFLPLLLGLLGLWFHAKRNSYDFWVVMLLFLFTGLAIVVYLNQYPYQPRERDYAYAGSFYAFAIWIGIGVFALYELLTKKIKVSKPAIAVGVTLVTLLAVPTIMAKENWNDHDRSNRYTARDFAKNYLSSCAPNAILFTNGDNDTFPLWYVQEVEGYRTDVRVVNLSLLNTDWYIDQCKRKAYNSEAVPFSMNHDKYVQGTRDYLPIVEQIKSYTDIRKVISFIKDDSRQTKLETMSGKAVNYCPAKNFVLPIDSATIMKNNVVSPKYADKIVKEIKWRYKKNNMPKADMMVFDLIANNNWKRPIYFAITVGTDGYMGLEDYFQLEGLAYRLVPIKNDSKDGQTGRIDTDKMYNNLMNKFVWGNINDPNVWLDENNLRMTMNFRNNFSRLADALIAEGKIDKAKKVMDKCLKILPGDVVPHNGFSIGVVQTLYRLNEKDKARDIINQMTDNLEQELNWYLSLSGSDAVSVSRDKQMDMAIYQELLRTANVFGDKEMVDKLSKKFDDIYSRYK